MARPNQKQFAALLDGIAHDTDFVCPIYKFFGAKFTTILKRISHCAKLYNANLCKTKRAKLRTDGKPEADKCFPAFSDFSQPFSVRSGTAENRQEKRGKKKTKPPSQSPYIFLPSFSCRPFVILRMAGLFLTGFAFLLLLPTDRHAMLTKRAFRCRQAIIGILQTSGTNPESHFIPSCAVHLGCYSFALPRQCHYLPLLKISDTSFISGRPG